jgi:DNA-binding GntR family transcriptional regulator
MATRIPQYRKVYEVLRKHIVDGVFKEGDLLPSENELCATYQITRPTVRHALDALVAGGYIKKHQGKGSIVASLPQGVGILSIAGTTTALGSGNLLTKIIVKPIVTQWDRDFFFNLSSAEKESGCIRMERVRLFNGRPIFYDINCLPNINLPRFTSRNFDNRSLFDVLRKSYNLEVKGGEQKIKAIPAGKYIGKHLDLETGHPVLHLERKFETNRIGYYFYSSIYCNTEDHAVFGVF